MKKFTFSLALLIAFSFLGCGGGGSNSSNGITTKNYNGAGSRWELNFKSDGNATIKELNSNLEINATWRDLNSGFKKITVVSSSDTTEANTGDVTYGVGLPKNWTS